MNSFLIMFITCRISVQVRMKPALLFLSTSCYLNSLCSSRPFVVIPVPRHWDPD
ncbi:MULTISPECIES: hypothetical protein [unclassified Wolbachia]|uniref:hypothetical protein n=1 Tax=unclassified Wolbachia TaxID=2640676 RepID=UPI001319E605|nr:MULTISPECIES: hypothetical protein [unclassified Wolbachia]